MATIQKGYTQVAQTLSGNSPQILYVDEGTATWSGHYIGGSGGLGQTSTGYWMKGALLSVNSTYGLDVVRKGHATTATGADRSLVHILGIAMEDATGTSTHQVPVLLATPDAVFVGNIASRTSVATASPSRATHRVGVHAGASCNGSRFYPMTVGASAGSSVLAILGKYDGDSWGDTYGRVLFKFQTQCLHIKA